MSSRILFVLQPTHRPIDEATAKSLLDSEALKLPSRCLSLDDPEASLDETAELDWASAQSAIVSLFRASIEPELRGGARVVYLGATPIPLAMQLGYLLGSWTDVDPYQCHHETGEWLWRERTGGASIVRIVGLVSELRSSTPCDVIIRVTSDPEINASATAAMVPDALMQVDVTREPRGRDALESREDLEGLAAAFQTTLDDLSDRLPRATFHVFAAVPVAMALELGRRVSPTRHRPVLVYQLVAREDPRFKLAFELQGASNSRARPIAAGDAERAATERAMWRDELLALSARASTMQDPTSWRQAHPALRRPPWSDLPDFPVVSPVLGAVALERTDVEGFLYDRGENAWVLADELLLAIAHRLSGEADRRAAARLFYLHEGLHEQVQGVTAATSQSVGRFPRVLEELDYQADTWALLQELDAGMALGVIDNDEAIHFLKKHVWIATETFWAFDAGDDALSEIQVRRMNRYLLWYWQSLKLERCPDLADAIGVLATKPVIEIAGLESFMRAGRPFYRLDPRRANRLEVAVIDGVALRRRPDGHAYPLGELVEGFRARSGETVLRALRGFLDDLSAWGSRGRP